MVFKLSNISLSHHSVYISLSLKFSKYEVKTEINWIIHTETFVPFIRKFTKTIKGHIELQFKISFSKQRTRKLNPSGIMLPKIKVRELGQR